MNPTEWGIIAPTSIYSYKRQWLVVFCRPSPDLVRSVSDERIAPNQSTRIANVRFYIGYMLVEKRVIVATIAHPQSRDFKR